MMMQHPMPKKIFDLPSHLPHLSIAEEMLIARAHVQMAFRRVKGCQYKYSGHVVNFMQNTTKIINPLPSLPTELQVVILKPPSSTVNDSAVDREFTKSPKRSECSVKTLRRGWIF